MKIVFIFLFCLCFFCKNGIAQFTRQTDSLALVALYDSTGGTNWANPWDLSKPMSTWQGVQVDSNRVVRLVLKENNLVGVIPTVIGNLTNLEVLNLSINKLSNSIPPNIGNLTKLVALSLYDNELTDAIPYQIGNLQKLNSLFLFNNNLRDTIPKEIGQLSNLSYLYLMGNQLTGSIPKEFSNLRNLKFLYLQNNQLSGFIPSELNRLRQLEDVDVSNNKLEQAPSMMSLPLRHDTLGAFPKGLRISSNKLTFDDILPNMSLTRTTTFIYASQDSIYKDTIFSKRRGDALTLDLGIDDTVSTNVYSWFKDGSLYKTISGNNKLSFSNLQLQDAGGYTCQVTNPNASLLTLYSRKATIKLTESCRYSDSLSLVSFYKDTEGNNWTRKDNWLVVGKPIETWFGVVLDSNGCLSKLNLPANKLKSPLPANLGDFVQLIELNLNSNALTGDIPIRISNLVNLKVLNLSNNAFNSPLPTAIGDLTNLKQLRFQSAGFKGPIPKGIYQLRNLQVLDLSSNPLNDSISAQIGLLTRLDTLLLNGIGLTGSIPKEIGQLSNLAYLDLSKNQLTRSIPKEIGNLKNLKILYLYDNQLTGALPKEIGQLVSLQYLGLFNNLIDSLIPKEIGQLKQMKGLNLGKNRFRGSLPSEIGNLTQLSYLYLNDNQLDRFIPLRMDVLSMLTNQFEIQKNKFTFKDILPNMSFRTIKYVPQDSIYKDTVLSANKGSTLIIDLGIDDTVKTNVYKWYKDGRYFREVYTNKLFLDNMQDSLTGVYNCEVTNVYVPNLTLYSRKIKVRLNCSAAQPTLSGKKRICLGDSTTLILGSNLYANYQWSTGKTTPSITLAPSVSDSIYVTVTDNKGCTAKDSIYIEVTTYPKNRDDNYSFLFGQESIKMAVTQNDNVVKFGKMELISRPLFGNIEDIGNGIFNYTTKNSFKIDSFRYRICDEICPLFCDTAKVTINLPSGTSIGIRPDCSCEDETLKFGDLPEYPELTILNRWGSPVFKAQPYRNDWKGVNQNNQLLPAATYYYILRLDKNENKVIGGDVTIIR